MAQLSQLLLFDPDPSGLDTLSYAFEKEGCSVTGTADAGKARDLILGSNPGLLVVNLRDVEKKGLELLRSTTLNPRTRNLPCVVIGREDLRASAMTAGAFVFLSTPLFVRDVLGACRLVAAASVPGSRPSPDAEVSLRLAELDGLYFLVRALAVTSRSVVVEVQRGPKHGELRFIDGTLTSAQMGPVQGLPALHQMLLWEDAGLHFRFKNVVRRGTPLSMKSSEVIEECDRFLRDFAHEARELGSARTVYLATSDNAQSSSALPGEVLPLLKLFDGHRDLGQILDDSPFRVFDTLKLIRRFVDGDAIHAQIPGAAASRETRATLSGPGALDYWLQRLAPGLGPEMGTVPAGTMSDPPQRVSRDGLAARPSRGFLRAGVGVSARLSSPFVQVPGGSTTSADKSSTAARTRTITQREHPVDPPLGPSPEDVVTPPPVVARPANASPKPAVARGEIKIATTSPISGSVPADGAPSVLVEIGTPPSAMPLEAAAPSSPSAESAPPSVIVAPMTPAPVATGRPRKQTPTPGVDSRRNPRSPSDSFNAVEADFFEREADLYKRESVESFEDLDGAARTARRPNGPVRKR